MAKKKTDPDAELDTVDPEKQRLEEKEAAIKKEKSRLKKAFKDLDANKKKTVEQLISTAAFLSVTLQELEEEINRKGVTEEYQNGANQYGVKQSAAAVTHIAMTKNLTAIMKQLADLVPAEKKQKSRLKMLRDE
ncbi:MAG: hypothetical protein IJI14_12155 [Anaerolineaceae bacterium]|nr:hypothetical protein [Anaerolineaceae bacterium]